MILGYDSGPVCSGLQSRKLQSQSKLKVAYMLCWPKHAMKHLHYLTCWLSCRSRRSLVSRLLIQRTLSLTWHVQWSKMALLCPRRSKHDLGQEFVLEIFNGVNLVQVMFVAPISCLFVEAWLTAEFAVCHVSQKTACMFVVCFAICQQLLLDVCIRVAGQYQCTKWSKVVCD